MYVLPNLFLFIYLFLIILVAINCTGGDIRRVLYRIYYSSDDNTISRIEVYALIQSSTINSRITIQWIDIGSNSPSSSGIFPRMNIFDSFILIIII